MTKFFVIQKHTRANGTACKQLGIFEKSGDKWGAGQIASNLWSVNKTTPIANNVLINQGIIDRTSVVGEYNTLEEASEVANRFRATEGLESGGAEQDVLDVFEIVSGGNVPGDDLVARSKSKKSKRRRSKKRKSKKRKSKKRKSKTRRKSR